MAKNSALILDGPYGPGFFLQSVLFDEQLVESVELVGRAQAAINFLEGLESISLIVINLFETGAEGMELALWLNQQPLLHPVILLVPTDQTGSLPLGLPFYFLTKPITLQAFLDCARYALGAP